MNYHTIVCGGTFDLLHEGHKSFLNQLISISDKLVIGLTSDEYVSEYKEGTIEEYETRKANLENFLNSQNYSDKYEIVKINNIYGPLLSQEFQADAIGVTAETQGNGRMINDKRKEQGLSPLDVVVIDITLAEDKKGISSTRIRNGEISRKGKVYIKEEWLRNQLLLPMNLRDELRKPFGIIIQELPEEIHGERTITIGDVTTQKFNLRNLGQILSIVDYQVKRHKLYEKITDLGFSSDIVIDEVVNEAATISPQLFRSIINAINEKKKSVILVKGEEDLAVIPAVLAAPLGFKIYYGQPDEGLVEVAVNPETKEKAFELLRRFSS